MTDQKLRNELAKYLSHGHTHSPLPEVVKNFPAELLNKRVKNLPYTAWELLEHIRISQLDMLDFIRNPKYKELQWPKGYWPEKAGTKQDWNKSFKKYGKDLETVVKIIRNPKKDLFAPIPWGKGQTTMQEVLQIIDHASNHTGQLVMLRRLLGIWKK
jgi:uncharacterized damage-inducible protein DinB